MQTKLFRINLIQPKFDELYDKFFKVEIAKKQSKSERKDKFRFIEGVLYRDGMDGILKFFEKDLQYNVLKIAFTKPFGERIDMAVGGLDCEKYKQLYDAARAINEKVDKEFRIKDFFQMDYPSMSIKRNVE
jgi:hypothetical protein